jgi:hypothetical protein
MKVTDPGSAIGRPSPPLGAYFCLSHTRVRITFFSNREAEKHLPVLSACQSYAV